MPWLLPDWRSLARVMRACGSAALAVASPLTDAAAESPSASSISFDELRPTLTSADGRFSISFRTRLQIDTGGFDQQEHVDQVTPLRDVEFKHLDSGGLVRRAYLGVEGRAFRDLWYEYRMDFGGSGFKLADPYIHLARISYSAGSYDDGPLIRVNTGLIKPIFTYGDPTSSASLTFLERAAVVNVATSAFGGGAPRLGAELTFQDTDVFRPGDNLVVSGAFTGHIADRRPSESPDDATGKGTHVLGRVAYRLWSDGVSNVQIGGSVARKLTVGSETTAGMAPSLTLEDRPEIRVDSNPFVSTGPLPTKGGQLWGLEAATNIGNLYLAGEFYRFGLKRDTACTGCMDAVDPDFSGWYVEGSWMLTGEAKLYQRNALNNGMATFANPRVGRSQSTVGAWEIAARYSDLDLNWNQGAAGTPCAGSSAGCVRGGKQEIWAFGVNWYLSDNIRLLFDVMFVDVDKLNSSGAQIGQASSIIGTRFQFTN